MITRHEYISKFTADEAGFKLHHDFYAQFVNDQTIAHVLRTIKGEWILESEDRYFNDISMFAWDEAVIGMPKAIKFSDVNDLPSPAGLVCIAKTAMRIWKEKQK